MTKLVFIPLLPLLGFIINGLCGNRLPKTIVSLIACALPASSFIVALVCFNNLTVTGVPITETLYTWISLDPLKIEATLYLDQISAVMCLIVTGVGTLIHIYSAGYMSHDESLARYFSYLNLFLFFMLILVLGKNMITLFVGWEGVGLASYLLIGFWYRDGQKTAAGMKAFIVNRVGDAGFLLAAFLIWYYARTLDFQDINAFFAGNPVSSSVISLIAILLLVGACGKSAQLPLHVWLPDAMAGPTPVSALIHAATMVTAGVYMLSRLNVIFLHAPVVMTLVAWGGAITALLGALMGLVQYNLKKVLAYSTMSQIGYMFMACGLGSFSAAIFHLYTHAFFKACLFLSAGAVIHALGGEEDMRGMGKLADKIPLTFSAFVIAAFALCGLPPFSGFFSKDEILWSAWSSPYGGSPLLWGIGIVTTGITAFYIFRAVIMTFFGKDNASGKFRPDIHVPPFSMSSVLVALAVFSVIAGLVGIPAVIGGKFDFGSPFFSFLEPALGHFAPMAGITERGELVCMAISVTTSLAGACLAILIYTTMPALPGVIKRKAQCLYNALSQGCYLDAAYRNLIVAPLDRVSESLLSGIAENALFYVTVERASAVARYAGNIFSRLQNGSAQAYALYAAAALALILWWGVVNV